MPYLLLIASGADTQMHTHTYIHPHRKKPGACMPGLKYEQPRTKTGIAEKDVKSNGWPMPPSFDRFESFGHDVILGAHGFPMLMGSKIFDKDDQAVKHYDKRTMFCSLVIFINNFDPINIRRP